MINSIKFIIILFFLVFLTETNGQLIPQFTTDPNSSLKQVHFVNELVGYTIGFNNTLGKALYKTTNGGITWELLNKTGQYDAFFFLNADTFYIWNRVQDPYSKTTDGGVTWNDGPFINDLSEIYFKDKYTGWKIFHKFSANPDKTTDGGLTWFTSEMVGFNELLNNILFVDSLNGYGIGEPNLFFKTTDGGLTWQKSTLNFLYNNSIYFLTSQIGWIGGYNHIYKTTNGGATWTSYFLNTPQLVATLNKIQFINENDGFALLAGCFIRTKDSGVTWFVDDYNQYYSDFCFINSYKGWAVVANKIFYTENGGVPVELISFSGKQVGNLIALSFQTASELNNHGFEIQRKFADKDWLTIAFKKGSGTTAELHTYSFNDIHPPEGKIQYRLKQMDYNGTYKIYSTVSVDFIASGFHLNQNFPNPFNPSTSITCYIPKEGLVKLIVYNIIGEVAAVLENNYKAPGIYEYIFNADKLKSGIYICKLEAGTNSSLIKMVLMK